LELEWWAWAAFGALVILLLSLDLAVFGRGRRPISFRSAAIWSIAWTVLGVAFAGVLWVWQAGTRRRSTSPCT